MHKEPGYTWKLGMFVIIGLVLFVLTIYFVGKEKNLFGSTFHLKTKFKTVSGLEVGNNVRFSGINVGTVKNIELTTDTSVMVILLIKDDVQQFIKADATASIGSDGLMGDKVLTISPGTVSLPPVKDNDMISSKSAIEMEDVMGSVKASVDNAGIITAQLAEFSYKMNNGNGALSKLISDEAFSSSLKSTLTNLQTSSSEFAKFTTKMNDGKGALSKLVSDEKFGKTLDSTMSNLQAGTKGLSENMEAAKNNILLRGYFNKKKKAEAKEAAALKKKADLKKKNDLKKSGAGKKITDEKEGGVLNATDSSMQQ
ncbi:MAG: MCE family protein [Ferruginibacter sp.]|nr:MCE family protein [Ferruginibacter sp.]